MKDFLPMPKVPLPPDVVAFIRERHPGVVSTIRPDGAPHAATTWYMWTGEHVLLNMDRGRRRLKHMEHEPRVALTVLDGDNWGRSLTLLGRVERFYQDADLADIDKLALRYQGYPFEARVRDSVTALVRVESWHGWDVDHIWGFPGKT
jgi:PPOX class probable F420-dependent enzyme